MHMNDKGQQMICSVKQLSPSQRRQVHLASVGMGALVLLIYCLGFLLIGSAPSKHQPFFFYYADWGMILAFGSAAFGLGFVFGSRMMIADLGYALPTRQQVWADALPHNQSFSSGDAPSYPASNTYGGYISINPSSGLPMSGSSGMDTHGNPFGTNAW